MIYKLPGNRIAVPRATVKHTERQTAAISLDNRPAEYDDPFTNPSCEIAKGLAITSWQHISRPFLEMRRPQRSQDHVLQAGSLLARLRVKATLLTWFYFVHRTSGH
jgi:hypothetical protein